MATTSTMLLLVWLLHLQCYCYYGYYIYNATATMATTSTMLLPVWLLHLQCYCYYGHYIFNATATTATSRLASTSKLSFTVTSITSILLQLSLWLRTGGTSLISWWLACNGSSRQRCNTAQLLDNIVGFLDLHSLGKSCFEFRLVG